MIRITGLGKDGQKGRQRTNFLTLWPWSWTFTV
jgi:hypothetical protein